MRLAELAFQVAAYNPAFHFEVSAEPGLPGEVPSMEAGEAPSSGRDFLAQPNSCKSCLGAAKAETELDTSRSEFKIFDCFVALS